MALDRFKYDITPYSRDLNLIDRLFYVERVVADVNTNGVSLMTCIDFGGTVVNFGGQSNTARGFLEYTVNRLGPLNHVEFTPIAAVDWYDVEITFRPIDLGIRLVPAGQDTRHSGRTIAAGSSLVFDINPASLPEDCRFMKPIGRRLCIDMVGTMTPVLNFDDGTSSTLTTLVHATRAIADLAILTGKRIKNVTLLGDFTDGANILYDIEMDIQVPNSRRVAVG